jgi:hypothetical protein
MSKHHLLNRASWRAVQCAVCLLPNLASAVNVDDFGALGDGTTWDHAAIQAAMIAAGNGGEVVFTAGKTYLQCKQLMPLQGQRIRGNGAVRDSHTGRPRRHADTGGR